MDCLDDVLHGRPSVETPLVTSEDGRSSATSEESKGNKVNTIKYDDRESQV